MKAVCELEEFFVNKLHIEWLKSDPDSKMESASFGFDYDLSCNKENPYQIRILMRFSLGSADEKENAPCPYAIDAEMEGFFRFEEDLDDQHMAYLCRVNSLTILYGILRGEIANVTGSFRGGKFILPTCMMQDVVKEVEARKVAERQKASAETSDAE